MATKKEVHEFVVEQAASVLGKEVSGISNSTVINHPRLILGPALMRFKIKMEVSLRPYTVGGLTNIIWANIRSQHSESAVA